MAANPKPQLVVGPYNLYIGESSQSAFPAASEDPPFTTATKVYAAVTDDEKDLPPDGFTIQRNAEYGQFVPAGARMPVKVWEKASAWVLSGMIYNWSSDIVAKLIEDGVTGKLGARGPILKEYRALIRIAGGSPESGNTGGDKNWQLEIPRCVIQTDVGSKFGLGDEPAGYTWRLACLFDETLAAAIKMVAEA